MDVAIVLEFLGLAAVQWGPNALAPITSQAGYDLFASTWPAASGTVPTYAAMQSAWTTIGSAAAYDQTKIKAAAQALLSAADVLSLKERAALLTLIDYLNTVGTQHNALLTWLGGQTTLANRNQLNGFSLAANIQPADAKQAVVNKIASNAAN